MRLKSSKTHRTIVAQFAEQMHTDGFIDRAAQNLALQSLIVSLLPQHDDPTWEKRNELRNLGEGIINREAA